MAVETNKVQQAFFKLLTQTVTELLRHLKYARQTALIDKDYKAADEMSRLQIRLEENPDQYIAVKVYSGREDQFRNILTELEIDHIYANASYLEKFTGTYLIDKDDYQKLLSHINVRVYKHEEDLMEDEEELMQELSSKTPSDADHLSCTKGIPIYLNRTLRNEIYSDITGDGEGSLRDSINADYRQWNRIYSTYLGTSSYLYTRGMSYGGWPDSAIRNTLNGVMTDNMLNITNKDNGFDEARLDKTNALISCFPDELQETIVPKAVKSDTVYNDITGNNVTTYDKLWLFSVEEIRGNGERPNEGPKYPRYTNIEAIKDNYIAYNKKSIQNFYWTRSISKDYSWNVCNASDFNNESNAVAKVGIAPGFCLPGPDPSIKYAVSVYGIMVDSYKTDDGICTDGIAPLTFGPATGASFFNNYVSRDRSGADHSGKTDAGNNYRCVHDDNWETIIEWSDKDPYVYEKCMGDKNHLSCTKAVPIYLSKPFGTSRYGKKAGDGVGLLYRIIQNSGYNKWNYEGSVSYEAGSDEYKYGTNQGGWPDSVIRNTLNGTVTDNMLNITNKDNGFDEKKLNESNALISCFPNILQTVIVPKAVKSDTVWNDTVGNNVTTYDKLWLLSAQEIYGDEYDDYTRPNEGYQYERNKLLGISKFRNLGRFAAYDEEYSARNSWTRSINEDYNYRSKHILSGGGLDNKGYSVCSTSCGVSPCFCIAKPRTLSTKYAVSVYGIEVDEYSEDEGATTHTAGLTFGPATGADFTSDYISKDHNGADHTGTTESGNEYRCIHDDDWSTIIEWNDKDPWVYEKCMGDVDHLSCTKSVPIYRNNILTNNTTIDMTGDGIGIIRETIQRNYMDWNRNQSSYFSEDSTSYKCGTNKGGWPDSAIRNTLNGTLTDNMFTVTNANNGFDEAKINKSNSLISCFPNILQNVIVPKAVKSDTDYDYKKESNVTTYDRLWLFSAKEIYDYYKRPNEGVQYPRNQKLGITKDKYSKNLMCGENNRWWLRTIYYDIDYECFYANMAGDLCNENPHTNVTTNSIGLSPGFVLR